MASKHGGFKGVPSCAEGVSLYDLLGFDASESVFDLFFRIILLALLQQSLPSLGMVHIFFNR